MVLRRTDINTVKEKFAELDKAIDAVRQAQEEAFKNRSADKVLT